MFGIEQKVEKAARKAAAFSIGGLLAAVGAGFLTTAAYMLISQAQTPLFAVTVLGLIYLGLAALAFAIGVMRQNSRRHGTPAHAAAALPGDLTPMQLVAVSFLEGLEQGRNARRPH